MTATAERTRADVWVEQPPPARESGSTELVSSAPATHRRRRRWFEANPGCLTQFVGPGTLLLVGLFVRGRRRPRQPLRRP